MSTTLLCAIISITSAFIIYTIGVYSLRKSKVLSRKHVTLFWSGLFFDSLGTYLMSLVPKSATTATEMVQMIHTVSGYLGIGLMLTQAVWASLVLYNQTNKKFEFHKISVIVWTIWLIPYFLGVVLGSSH